MSKPLNVNVGRALSSGAAEITPKLEVNKVTKLTFAEQIVLLDTQIDAMTDDVVKTALSNAKTQLLKQHIRDLQHELKATRMLVPKRIIKPRKAA